MSRLCLGTDRTPTSTISESVLKNISVSSYATVPQIRDTRLRLMSKLLVVANRGLTIRLADPSDLDRWYQETLAFLSDLEQLRRLIKPLPGRCHMSVTKVVLISELHVSRCKTRNISLSHLVNLSPIMSLADTPAYFILRQKNS